MGYNAIYPAEAVEAHRAFIGRRAFIARRRSLRPSEEHRTPTAQEWDAFLGHFERPKLSVPPRAAGCSGARARTPVSPGSRTPRPSWPR